MQGEWLPRVASSTSARTSARSGCLGPGLLPRGHFSPNDLGFQVLRLVSWAAVMSRGKVVGVITGSFYYSRTSSPSAKDKNSRILQGATAMAHAPGAPRPLRPARRHRDSGSYLFVLPAGEPEPALGCGKRRAGEPLSLCHSK